MKRIIAAGFVTVGLVLWAHQLPTIGGRVPMVFVALWFGSASMVALIFSMDDSNLVLGGVAQGDINREHLWRRKLRTSVFCLLPLTLVPLLESRGVGNDPAVWQLDCALLISIFTAPYFTLVAKGAFGGTVLSIGAFQAVWTCLASIFYVIMERQETAKGGRLAQGASFEEFFRPEYRYLFYILCALMLLGYCPALLRLGHRRFLRMREVGI